MSPRDWMNECTGRAHVPNTVQPIPRQGSPRVTGEVEFELDMVDNFFDRFQGELVEVNVVLAPRDEGGRKGRVSFQQLDALLPSIEQAIEASDRGRDPSAPRTSSVWVGVRMAEADYQTMMGMFSALGVFLENVSTEDGWVEIGLTPAQASRFLPYLNGIMAEMAEQQRRAAAARAPLARERGDE